MTGVTDIFHADTGAGHELASYEAGRRAGRATRYPYREDSGAMQLVNPICNADWDTLVMAHSHYSFFHSAAWAQTLERTYDYEPIYLKTDGGSSPAALLPLMEVNNWPGGRRGIALPFTDDCGPLYEDASSAQFLVRRLFELGKSRRWKSMELRGGRELFPDAPASRSYYGHTLKLEEGEERIFGRFDSSVRRAIRKAERSGVTVNASGDLKAMKIFYSLLCLTRRKHGLPPQPFAFFLNICRQIFYRDLGMVVIARYGNRPIAASVYFQLGAKAVYKFGASDESAQHMRGTDLVMWEAIRHLTRNGVTMLDFGRTSIGNEGLRRFKLGWGAREHKIEYVKYNFRRNLFVTEDDAVKRWYNRVFRALPLGASRMIGAMLYRRMA